MCPFCIFTEFKGRSADLATPSQSGVRYIGMFGRVRERLRRWLYMRENGRLGMGRGRGRGLEGGGAGGECRDLRSGVAQKSDLESCSRNYSLSNAHCSIISPYGCFVATAWIGRRDETLGMLPRVAAVALTHCGQGYFFIWIPWGFFCLFYFVFVSYFFFTRFCSLIVLYYHVQVHLIFG